MRPGMLQCNGTPGGGIPLQQARTRGQEMVTLDRLFRGSRCGAHLHFSSLISLVQGLPYMSLSVLSSYQSEPGFQDIACPINELYLICQTARNLPFDPC